jgi:hypothetical protein
MKVQPNKVSARVVNTLKRAVRAHERLGIGRIRERDLAAFGLADPVGLHGLHTLGPVGSFSSRLTTHRHTS